MASFLRFVTGSPDASPMESPRGTKRLLPSCGLSRSTKRRATGTLLPCPRRSLEEELAAIPVTNSEALPFCALSDGPYLVIASWLSAPDLARADVACRRLRSLNAERYGPWRSIGSKEFYGMELDVPGGFFPFDDTPRQQSKRGPNWKFRYSLFHFDAPTFSTPFEGKEICEVEGPDEVAYCRCRLRTDLLLARPDYGVYVEMEVRINADNLSMALVDFDGGGCSSVTFSPETGAVLRERKVCEQPRAIEGTYMHFLPSAPQGDRFEGRMGLFVQNGHIAFYRRWAVGSGPTEDTSIEENRAQLPSAREPAWETTGFCTDLRWAFGPRLSLCLAFRDAGRYHVCIGKISHAAPTPTHKAEAAYQEGQWKHLYGDDDHPLAT